MRLIERHGDEIVATANRYTLSPEDAEDAYQRGLEVLLKRAPTIAEEELLPWMKKVVKHEAFAIYHARKGFALPGNEQIEQEAGAVPEPQEQVERYERLRHGAEAIRRLKPQEIRALVLRADGLTYRQIAEVTGWTRTKVNRCLTEGRRSFVKRVTAIESGAECERLAPLLSAFADGEARATDVSTLRPHLRSCLACRASLRAFRELPHRAAEVVPLPVAAEAGPRLGDAADAVWRWGESATAWAQERAGLIAAKTQAAVEGSSATKAAAVAASAAALAGGTLVGSHDGGPGDPGERATADSGTGLLERAAPANLVPRIPPAPEEPVPVASLEPVAVEPAPVEPLPVAPSQAPVTPAPAAPAPEPVAQASGRSERFPARVTIPVENPGQSALEGVEEGEREQAIGPTTKPVEPLGRPDARSTDDGQ